MLHVTKASERAGQPFPFLLFKGHPSSALTSFIISSISPPAPTIITNPNQDMCTSTSKPTAHSSISHIDGRPVLQPAGNRVSQLLERRNSLSNTHKSSILNHPTPNPTKLTNSPVKSPRPPAIKRSGANHTNLNSSGDKPNSPPSPTSATKSPTSKTLKKSKQCPAAANATNNLRDFGLDISFLMAEAPPGSIAAARREQVAIMQVQRKMKTAHYGRSKSAKYLGKVVLPSAMPDSATASASDLRDQEIKRCSFITSNSDPIYIAYHDEEWGVPVHDDKMLFELLILTAAQLGSDWTSVLKKRQDFREAFSGFDAEIVSAYSEKRITSIVADYGIELSQVRGAVDNANRILVIRREFGTLDKYLWNFVNQKPMQTQYKSSNKIPVKTSKSEAMSKDLVRRGFRYVGATVMLSFMQAAGLTNDHLLDCPRHQHCCLAATSNSKPN